MLIRLLQTQNLKILGLFWLTTVSVFVNATTEEKVIIDVLVVPTQDALDWATEERFSCDQFTQPPENNWRNDLFIDRSLNELEAFYMDSSQEARRKHVAQINELFNLTHVCQSESSSSLGHFNVPGDWSPDVEALAYMRNLIDISIAETNQTYKDSGVRVIEKDANGNEISKLIEFRLVGWDIVYYSWTSGEPFIFYPSLGDYKEFKDPTPKHRNWIVQLGASSLKGEDKGQGEISNLRNLSYQGMTDEESKLEAVHEYRRWFDADIVVMLTGEKMGIVGEAVGLGVTSPDNSFFWSTASHATAPHYSFAHEMTHLFGVGHYGLDGSPLTGFFDTQAEYPEYISGRNGQVYNQGFIGQYDLKDSNSTHVDYLYYGTLMSKSSDCQNYIQTVNEDDEDWTYLSGSKPNSSICNSALFDSNYIQLPRISENLGKLSVDGKQIRLGNIYRNGAQSASKYITKTNVSEFSENLSRALDREDKIGIDFGMNYNGFTNYRTKTTAYPYWNNITNKNYGTSLSNLIYEDGSASNIGVKVSRSFDKTKFMPTITEGYLAFGVSDMPTMAMTDGMLTNTHGRVTLTGLKTNNTPYKLRIFSSAPTIHGPSYAKISITKGEASDSYGRETTSCMVKQTNFNVYHFFDFDKIIPDSNGEIEFKIEPIELVGDKRPTCDDYTNSYASKSFSVSLNAIEIFENRWISTIYR